MFRCGLAVNNSVLSASG
jgi:hypothetical protein